MNCSYQSVFILQSRPRIVNLLPVFPPPHFRQQARNGVVLTGTDWHPELAHSIDRHPSYRQGRTANIFGIVIQGTSMAPEIQDGDYVIYDRDKQPAIDDLVMAIVDGAIFAKRLIKDGKKLVLRGDGDGIVIPLDDYAEIVGRIIFITRPK